MDGYLSSHYHSLQTSIRRQFSNGLMLQGAYTWSKAINMTDDDGWAAVNWNWAPVFDRNRAPAGYDRTHVFQIGWVYDLPFGKDKPYVNSGFLSHVIGNWEVDRRDGRVHRHTFQRHRSRKFLECTEQYADGRPGKAGRPKAGAGRPRRMVVDPTAFATVKDQRFGTLGRNIMRRPGSFQYRFDAGSHVSH